MIISITSKSFTCTEIVACQLISNLALSRLSMKTGNMRCFCFVSQSVTRDEVCGCVFVWRSFIDYKGNMSYRFSCRFQESALNLPDLLSRNPKMNAFYFRCILLSALWIAGKSSFPRLWLVYTCFVYCYVGDMKNELVYCGREFKQREIISLIKVMLFQKCETAHKYVFNNWPLSLYLYHFTLNERLIVFLDCHLQSS